MKMFLLCVSSFVVTCFLYLCYQTRSPLSDVFTTGRVSLLKDRPENITKDIIVDMSNISAYGGVWTLTEAIISDIMKKRPNWRLIVLVQKDSLFKVPRGTNVKIIETSSRSLPFSISNVLSGTLYDKLIQLLYYTNLVF